MLRELADAPGSCGCAAAATCGGSAEIACSTGSVGAVSGCGATATSPRSTAPGASIVGTSSIASVSSGMSSSAASGATCTSGASAASLAVSFAGSAMSSATSVSSGTSSYASGVPGASGGGGTARDVRDVRLGRRLGRNRLGRFCRFQSLGTLDRLRRARGVGPLRRRSHLERRVLGPCIETRLQRGLDRLVAGLEAALELRIEIDRCVRGRSEHHVALARRCLRRAGGRACARVLRVLRRRAGFGPFPRCGGLGRGREIAIEIRFEAAVRAVAVDQRIERRAARARDPRRHDISGSPLARRGRTAIAAHQRIDLLQQFPCGGHVSGIPASRADALGVGWARCGSMQLRDGARLQRSPRLCWRSS